MPNGDDVEFSVNDEGTELTFVLPANVSDGTIRMIPASGVEVAVATIGVAVPEDVVAEPAADIWAGDVIKLKGLNMELITDVLFPNVEDAVAPKHSRPQRSPSLFPQAPGRATSCSTQPPEPPLKLRSPPSSLRP